MGAALIARDVHLAYGQSPPVLQIDLLAIDAGEALGVSGPSGSGKTSLLHVLAGVERPQRGRIAWDGLDIADLPERARDRWRRRTVGLVFQDFHLFPGLSAIDNVLLPITFERAFIPGWLRGRAQRLLADVGIRDGRAPVDAMSRGELQRVALARAVLPAPDVVLADEPTASLDRESGRVVTDLLVSMCREARSTLVVVSHDAAVLRRMDRVATLADGRLTDQPVEHPRGERSGPPVGWTVEIRLTRGQSCPALEPKRAAW